MTKSESFNWHRTSKVCNGLYDFGFLRDKPNYDEKPKFFSIYFSKTVFIVGIVAGFTFMICLILADKYQKSASISHHYASFIYEKEREKFLHDKNHYNGTKNNNDTIFRIFEFKKIQNLSKNIPIEEINGLMPITTVLHSVNSSNRNGKALFDKRIKQPNLNELNRNISEIRFTNTISKNPLNLADLLKRTELKTVKFNTKIEHTTTEANTMQFVQLESYKHYYNTKNVQDLLKYVKCDSTIDCVGDGENKKNYDALIQKEKNLENKRTDGDNNHNHHYEQIVKNQIPNENFKEIPEASTNNVVVYSESTAPLYYSPYFSEQHPIAILDPFYSFRASNPMEINDLDESENKEQVVHRFSNRMYHKQNINHDPSYIYSSALESYLQPPTPSPTSLSFTPSYMTTIFQEYDDETNQQEELKSEATAAEPVMQTKPISLMVEIFPANNYELPGSLFRNNIRQFPMEERLLDDSSRVNNPSWFPWKLSPSSPYSQNSMRLYVNFFPQQVAAEN